MATPSGAAIDIFTAFRDSQGLIFSTSDVAWLRSVTSREFQASVKLTRAAGFAWQIVSLKPSAPAPQRVVVPSGPLVAGKPGIGPRRGSPPPPRA